MRKRRHSTVTKEKATRYTKKLINLLTWFYYGKRPKMSQHLYLQAFCKARKFHF